MAFLVIPASLTTQLQAVNALIRSIGEPAVDTISPPTHEDAAEALDVLNDVDLELQTEGWSWNTDHDLLLSLDGNSKVPLPDQTLWCGPSQTEAVYQDIVQRGGFMYDRQGHTLVFTQAPSVDIIVRQDWDTLPQAARRYITLQAAQRFQATKQGSSVVLQVNAADIQRARKVMEQREDDDARNNTTYSTAVQTALSGNGGMQRNRRGLVR